MPDRVAVTNGSNTKQRLVLRNAAVQLLDSHGNAASGGGVQVGHAWKCSVMRAGLHAQVACMQLGSSNTWASCPLHQLALMNPCGELVMQVRFRLRHLPVAAADGASELPELGEPQAGMLETDDRGRAFVGDLCIAEGSGTPEVGRAI